MDEQTQPLQTQEDRSQAATMEDKKSPPNTEQLLKMKVPVIVKVAEKRALLKDILKWNLGSLLLFDKDAYQLIDLMVNRSTIGRGQPVKIGEKFGLKIIEISDMADTIRSLGEHPSDHL